MKWELEKVLSLRIGDDKKEWILSKNLKKIDWININWPMLVGISIVPFS